MQWHYSRYATPPPTKTSKNWFLIVNLVLAVTLSVISIIIELSAKPPVTRYDEARKAVAQARSLQANIYAPELLLTADLYLEQARQAWASENKRWIYRRDFNRTAQYAQKTIDAAEHAAMRATTVRDSLRWVASTGISLVKKRIDEIRPQFKDMPIDTYVRQKFALGEIFIMESEEAFKRGDYRRAVARYQVAAAKIGSAGDEVLQILDGYFVNTAKWRKWVQETIHWSAENDDIVLLVDKLAHICHVYKAGTEIAKFPVELGPNWLGHKRQRGDGATPEGRYRIKKKKANRQTVYYKALEIDYPNAEDWAQFNAAKRRGDIAARASIGGLIEVHGDGGKGANWTAGCVALRNSDMDKIYEMTKVGTPITIVGSLRGISTNPGRTQAVQYGSSPKP